MEVAVLGAGNGGCAVAFDLAQHGHDVRLFASAEYPGEVAAIAERGEIVSTGELSGAAPISYAGHDAARAVSGAGLIMVVGPAYATESFALAAAPHLTPEQAIVVCPTSCWAASPSGVRLGCHATTISTWSGKRARCRTRCG